MSPSGQVQKSLPGVVLSLLLHLLAHVDVQGHLGARYLRKAGPLSNGMGQSLSQPLEQESNSHEISWFICMTASLDSADL